MCPPLICPQKFFQRVSAAIHCANFGRSATGNECARSESRCAVTPVVVRCGAAGRQTLSYSSVFHSRPIQLLARARSWLEFDSSSIGEIVGYPAQGARVGRGHRADCVAWFLVLLLAACTAGRAIGAHESVNFGVPATYRRAGNAGDLVPQNSGRVAANDP